MRPHANPASQLMCIRIIPILESKFDIAHICCLKHRLDADPIVPMLTPPWYKKHTLGQVYIQPQLAPRLPATLQNRRPARARARAARPAVDQISCAFCTHTSKPACRGHSSSDRSENLLVLSKLLSDHLLWGILLG